LETNPSILVRLREPLVVLLLLFGGFFIGVGWLLGLWLLWESPCWTRREKRLGSLIPVAEIALLAVLVAVGSSGTGPTRFTVGDGLAWALIAGLVLATVGLAGMLVVRRS